jgi:uncharacterized membrane protein YoaK (UPF0700 family)
LFSHLRPLTERERDFLLIALASAAGVVDSISYFQLDHVFAANMTGNTVLLGLALGELNVLASLRSVSALVGFIIGVGLGAILVGRGRKPREWPASVTRAIVVELAILVVFAYLRSVTGISLLYGLIILLSLAMGLQSAATRHLDLGGVGTTYMTGTLTNLIIGVIGWVGPADLPAASIHGGTKSGRKLSLELLGRVYLVYFFSTVVAGFLQVVYSRVVTLLPLIILSFVVIIASIYHFDLMQRASC